MVLTAAIMLFAPELVLGIYVDPDAAGNAALMAFAVQFMVVAAAFQLFDGMQAVAAGALRGPAGHPGADAVRAVRLLAAGLRHRDVARLLHAARGAGGVARALLVGLVVVALAHAAALERRARLGLLPGLIAFLLLNGG